MKFSEEEAIKAAERGRPDLVISQKSIEVAWKRTCRSQWASFLPRIDANYDNMGQSKDYDNAQYRGTIHAHLLERGPELLVGIFLGRQHHFPDAFGEEKGPGPAQGEYEDAMASCARSEVIRSLLDIQAARTLIAASIKGVDAAGKSLSPKPTSVMPQIPARLPSFLTRRRA